MRRILFPVGLIGVGLVMALFVSEIAFRAAGRFVCVPSTDGGLYQLDNTLGWKHRPGVTRTYRGCLAREFEFEIEVTTNEEGLRDTPTPLKPQSQRRRILVLGDSITEAVQVELEETFVQQLEQRLSQAGSPVDVINTGVAGYATDNQLIYYQTQGRDYEVDEVLLVLNYNDIQENLPQLYLAEWSFFQRNPKPAYRLEADGSLKPLWLDREASTDAPKETTQKESSSVAQWLTRNFYLLRMLDRQLHRPVKEASADPPPPSVTAGIFIKPSTLLWHQAWKTTEALVAKLQAEVVADGRRFRVAIFPPRGAVTDTGWYRERALVDADPAAEWNWLAYETRAAQMLERLKIETIPLGAALREAKKDDAPLFFALDVHMTAAGHRVVADTLAKALKQ